MAYNKRFFDPTGSGSKGTKTYAIYQSADDAKAAINAAGYFNAASDEFVRVGLILIVATDATYLAKATVAGGVVTLAAPDAFA